MNKPIYGGTTTTPIPLAVTDQKYDPTSKNAQSGIAVAEAISKIPGGGGGSVDLSNYYTKAEMDTKTNNIEANLDSTSQRVAEIEERLSNFVDVSEVGQ